MNEYQTFDPPAFEKVSGETEANGTQTRARVAPPAEPPRSKPEPPSRNKPVGSRATVAALAVWLIGAYAAQYVVRRAIGEFWIAYPSETSIESALQAVPYNHLGWMRWGLLRAHSTGDPLEGIPSLRRAVELKPQDSQALVNLGLQLEAGGQTDEAEQALARAAAVDRGFQPRWSLANFYLRRADEGAFWKWIRDAIDADPSSVEPAAQLCWRVSADSSVILDRAIPDRPYVNRRYLDFLLNKDDLPSLIAVWKRLRPHLSDLDRRAGMVFTNRLIDGREIDRAIQAWNDMATLELIPFAPLSADTGPNLTNGNLDEDLSGWGLNWSIPAVAGVRSIHNRVELEPSSVEFRMSGAQPEYTLLLTQAIPVIAGRAYRLSFEYATQNLPQQTGMRWSVKTAPGVESSATPPLRAAEDFWDSSTFEFQAPPDAKILFLEFEYQRVIGTPRQRGRFVLRDLSLTRIEAARLPPAETVPPGAPAPATDSAPAGSLSTP